jgi:GTPase
VLKAILIDIVPPGTTKEDEAYRLSEAESLIKTFGGIVVLKKIQKKIKPDYNTYVGKGKIEEIIEDNKTLKANIIIINNELKPKQTYKVGELVRKSDLQVWDRVDLILKIFQKHASTREAKLEIELASIKHMGPRIYGMGMELSRQGGGIGTKGVGETNIEFMRRHLSKMEHRITKQLDECKKNRKLHRYNRNRQNFKTIGIIGYTNAGKSCLLNALTNKGALTANKLFATLDTRVGKMFIDSEHKDILVSDTIGFIQDLPTTLIKSFQSTLEETIESGLLLHVIDINDKKMSNKIKVVNEILAQIDALQKPTMYIFNKIDLLKPEEKLQIIKSVKKTFHKHNPQFVSAVTGEGIQDLKTEIKKVT